MGNNDFHLRFHETAQGLEGIPADRQLYCLRRIRLNESKNKDCIWAGAAILYRDRPAPVSEMIF